MEFLRMFIKEGYLKAIGKMEEYKIILGSGAYFEKGILQEEDLVEISNAIEESRKIEEIIESPIEEEIENNETEE